MNFPSYPPVSADTLFHFTGSKENLISILTDEFCPHFCLEDLTILNRSDDNAPFEIAIPMVSFCDLPLSQIGFHLSVYGDYGIGMSKTWARRKGITPVLYLHRDSLIVSRLGKMLNQSFTHPADPNLLSELDETLFDLACFFKLYEGNLWRQGRQRKAAIHE
jgi:hypothetical protein